MQEKMRQRKARFCVQSGSRHNFYIDDDDFHWDALLKVNGDFESGREKLRYMRAIAKILSDNEDKIPYCSASEAK